MPKFNAHDIVKTADAGAFEGRVYRYIPGTTMVEVQLPGGLGVRDESELTLVEAHVPTDFAAQCAAYLEAQK